MSNSQQLMHLQIPILIHFYVINPNVVYFCNFFFTIFYKNYLDFLVLITILQRRLQMAICCVSLTLKTAVKVLFSLDFLFLNFFHANFASISRDDTQKTIMVMITEIANHPFAIAFKYLVKCLPSNYVNLHIIKTNCKETFSILCSFC